MDDSVAVEVDSQGVFAWLAALLGLGGGGAALKLHTTQSDHNARIKVLEKTVALETKKTDDTHTAVTALATHMEHVRGDICKIHEGVDAIKTAVDRNANLYIARRREKIIREGDEVDE